MVEAVIGGWAGDASSDGTERAFGCEGGGGGGEGGVGGGGVSGTGGGGVGGGGEGGGDMGGLGKGAIWGGYGGNVGGSGGEGGGGKGGGGEGGGEGGGGEGAGGGDGGVGGGDGGPGGRFSVTRYRLASRTKFEPTRASVKYAGQSTGRKSICGLSASSYHSTNQTQPARSGSRPCTPRKT